MTEIFTLDPHVTPWRRAVGYALANARRKMSEEVFPGDPEEVLRDWIAYYLSQQWKYKMPPGGVFSEEQ